MPLLARLAFRNLWRNRRRTVVTFSALAVGIALLIFLDSLSAGFGSMGFQNLVDFETGEVQVHAPGYFEDRDNLPLKPGLAADQILEAVRGARGVVAATPRVLAAARLNAGWEEFPVLLVGMDPATHGGVFPIAEYVQGRLPEAGRFEAVLGEGIASLLDIGVGDVILLITRTRDHAFQALDLEVVGLLRTPNPTVNQNHVYMPLDMADTALALGGEVTEIVVRGDGRLPLEALVRNVRGAVAETGVPAEVYSWEEGAADLIMMMQVDAATNFLVTGIILVVALVGVTNTILLGSLERRREIGVMKAMGMRESRIVGLFLLEATGIALLAIVIGFAVGSLANLYLVKVGLDLTAFVGEVDWGVPIGGVVYGTWNGVTYLRGAVAAIVTCWLAAYWPARRAARLDPATSIRR